MRMTIDTSTTLPRLSPEARRHLRQTITAHAQWDKARVAAGLDKASDIRKEHYQVLANYLGIDLAPYHSDAWQDLPGAKRIVEVGQKLDSHLDGAPDLEPAPADDKPADDKPALPSLPDVLARIEPVLNDKVAADLRKAIDKAVSEARQQAAGRNTAAAAAVRKGDIVLPSSPARSETLGSVFGVKGWAKDLPVACWDRPDAPGLDQFYRFDSQALSYLLPFLQKQVPTWFYGYAGTGKSTFWENVAAKLGMGYTLIALSEESEFAPFVGQYIIQPDGSMKYEKGSLPLAMQRPGEIIHIDEISKAMSVVDQFQTLLSSGRLEIPETGEVVELAPGSCFVITDNTAGSGDETGLHSHAKEQCKALINRCGAMLQARFLPAEVECKVIANRLGLGDPAAVLPFVALANKTRESAETDEPIGHRDLLAWVTMARLGAPVDEAFEICVTAKLRPAYREHARQAYKAHFDRTAARAITSA